MRTYFSMCTKKILYLFIIFLLSPTAPWAIEDEITFFNVGQGHCTLVRRVGYVPLLIDAGSKKNVRRVKNDQPDLEGSARGERVIDDIVNKITAYWNDNNSPKDVLNVIVTHGDEDHVRYIPTILTQLRQRNNQANFRLLLGGVPEHYEKIDPVFHRTYNHLFSSLSSNYHYSLYYVPNDPLSFGSLFAEGSQLGFWGESGCITHLYCPLGNLNTSNRNLDEKKNTWSLITRIEINREKDPISVMITGDGEEAVQQKMLSKLGPTRIHEIRSDILLYPHHGAHCLNSAWAHLVNPRAVVISAGNYGGYYHPRKEALSSLFPKSTSLSNLTHQINRLSLGAHNDTPLERLWEVVDSHRIVYYDDNDQLSTHLRSIFPTSRHRFQSQNETFSHEWEPFEFSSEPWYITLEPGWKCAQLNLPIYTTYTSGTMVFKRKPLSMKHFEIEFRDIPSDIELMAHAIQGNLLDEDRINRIGDEVYKKVSGVIDDKVGDYSDFLRLRSTTVRESFRKLQAFHNIRPGLSRKQAIRHAGKIFFLCFNIIPVIETNGDRDELREYRELNFATFLEYFRNATIHINFKEVNERLFFDQVVDLLFADAGGYRNFNLVKKFQDRICIFNAFIQSQHYHDVRREDWLYLYCLTYKYAPDHRHLLAGTQLSHYVQSMSTIPFYQSSGVYPRGGLEDRLKQAKYFYYQCTGTPQYFNVNLEELPDLVRELYALQLDEQRTETIADLLSWLPRTFSAPVHMAARKLAPFAAHLVKLKRKQFKLLGNNISRDLLTMPRGDQLDILEHAISDIILK